jgi:hypothetical protein
MKNARALENEHHVQNPKSSSNLHPHVSYPDPRALIRTKKKKDHRSLPQSGKNPCVKKLNYRSKHLPAAGNYNQHKKIAQETWWRGSGEEANIGIHVWRRRTELLVVHDQGREGAAW